MKIGVCISTTPDRLGLFKHCWDVWEQHMPYGAVLTYVNDECGAGVARTKNASLKVLESLGVTDFFLVDNDTVPISKDWWIPYTEHSEHHLMYQFKLPGKPKKDMEELYRDDKTVAYSHTRGAMLYVDNKVLEVVGGMDTRYYNGFEHPDWTNRIFNAGLTTFRAMDVPNSHELLYCLDQDGEVESSIARSSANRVKNASLYRASRNSREYKEFRV